MHGHRQQSDVEKEKKKKKINTRGIKTVPRIYQWDAQIGCEELGLQVADNVGVHGGLSTHYEDPHRVMLT